MSVSLPVSRLIRVSINLAPGGAQAQNLSVLLILGGSDVIDPVERMRVYNSITDVAADFGTSAPEYRAAVLWFEQTPQPTSLMIGRWLQTASHGKLVGAPLAQSVQAIAGWNAITAGSFTVTVDGGSAQPVVGLNFSADANLNAVASRITAALTGATVTWNAAFQRFEVESTTTGAASSVTFFAPTGSGTDISARLGLAAGSSGAYRVIGAAAESALQAVQTFEQQFSQQWYAVTVAGAVNDDHLAIAAFIEATTTKHAYGVTTQEAGVLVATDTTNIAYQLKQLSYDKTMVQFSSSNAYAVVSALARLMTTDYEANNTTITLMYKQEPGIVPENLNSTQITALEANNCNVFAAYNNNTAIFEPGVMASGNFADSVFGLDWFAADLMTAIYNALYTSPTKIPQTDDGNHTILTVCESECAKGVNNGLFAPGTWQSAGFGSLNNGDFMSKGFYVYAPPIATQAPNLRAARKSVPFQIAVKLAGAIHTVDVLVTVNR